MSVMEQIWHVVTELWVNPIVRGIFVVSSIIGVMKNDRMVFKACQKSLSSIKETVLGLLVVAAFIRAPQRYLATEPLLSPFAVRLAYFLLIAAVLGGFAAASRTRPRV